MTVAALPTRATYVDTGDVATLYAIPFQYLSTDQVQVSRFVGGVETVLGGFAVTGDGRASSPTGKVQLASAVASSTIEIRRVTARTQPAVYTDRADFPADLHEDTSDREMMAIQEQDADLARTFKAPRGEVIGDLPAAADRAGKALAFSGDGLTAVPLVIGDANDPGLRDDLADGDLGALLVATKRPEAPAVLRLLSSRNDEIVYAKDYGCTGLFAQDATENLTDALAYMPVGGVLDFSHGMDSGGDFKVTDSLVIDRHISLRGCNSRIVGVMADSVTDLIRYVPSAEIRNVFVSGLRLVFNTNGRHALYVGNDTVGVLQFTLDNCALSGGAGFAAKFEGIGVHHNRITGSSFAGTTFAQSSNIPTAGGLHLACADGAKVQDNEFIGIGVGILVDLIAGSLRTDISNNAIVPRDIGVFLRAVEQLTIADNTFEQAVDLTLGTNVNQATYKAHIAMLGAGFVSPGGPGKEDVRTIDIDRNNFGGGDNQNYAIIAVGNTRDVEIGRNVFGPTGMAGVDISIASATCVETRILPSNTVNGTRGIGARGTANSADPKDLLLVQDLGTGTVGYAARKAFTDLASRGAGWSGSTFKFWKNAEDRLMFSGTLAVDATGGSVAAGFPVGTLPVGFRPAAAELVNVANTLTASPTAGAAPATFVIGTDGTIKCANGVVASSTFHFGAVPAIAIQGQASYLSGIF